MSVRTKLILIFLALSVVPLTLLTFFSYTNSRQSLTDLVERDNRAAAERLQGRVASLSGEIRHRVVAVTELPEFQDIDFTRPLSADDTGRLARAMRREVGARWSVFRDLEFEAAVPGTPRAAGGRKLLRKPPPDPAPLPPQARTLARSGDAAPAGELGSGGRRDPTVRVFLPDFAQMAAGGDTVPELKQYDLSFDEGAPSEESLEHFTGQMGGLLDNLSNLPGLFVQTGAEGRSIKLRNMAQEVRSELLRIGNANDSTAPDAPAALDARRRAILERLDRQTRELDQPITVPVERAGARVGSIVAHVRPDRLLADVFGDMSLEEGEVIFAVDPLGRLHARETADLATLADLGLLAPGAGKDGATAMAITQDPEVLSTAIKDPDWITVVERDEDTGYTFGIVRRLSDELGAIRQAAMMNLFLGVLFIGLAGSGVIVFSSRMTRRLEFLAVGARQIAGGDLAHRIDARHTDEIGQLAVAFNEMAADLDRSRQRLVEQERMERELEIARHIQRDSLPRTGFTGNGVEIAGRSIPSLEVGGDFFNFIGMDDDRTAILVGDVSGKGVPAALMMAEVQATFRTLLRFEDDPARIIARINRDQSDSKPDNLYFTAFFAVIDPAAGRLTYVNAGQTPPFIMRGDGTTTVLGGNTRPVGMYADSPVRADTARIDPGDLICVYTDGVVESSAKMRSEEFFGEERVVDAVRAALVQSPERVIDEVARCLTGFHGTANFEDDATLVVARLCGSPPGERATVREGATPRPEHLDGGLPVV
ncbi:MAG: PP2C family protein-serine/threonine phosphatase [Acidobacteriota bacterium]